MNDLTKEVFYFPLTLQSGGKWRYSVSSLMYTQKTRFLPCCNVAIFQLWPSWSSGKWEEETGKSHHIIDYLSPGMTHINSAPLHWVELVTWPFNNRQPGKYMDTHTHTHTLVRAKILPSGLDKWAKWQMMVHFNFPVCGTCDLLLLDIIW